MFMSILVSKLILFSKFSFKFIRNHNVNESFYERMHQFNAKHAINI